MLSNVERKKERKEQNTINVKDKPVIRYSLRQAKAKKARLVTLVNSAPCNKRKSLLFGNTFWILLSKHFPELRATCIVPNLSGEFKALLTAHDSPFDGSISSPCSHTVLTTKLDKPIFSNGNF
jgi:hypothetical protein